MLVLRTQGMSYPKIGKLFNKDHTTIIHWCKRFNVNVGTPLPIFENGQIKDRSELNKNAHKYAHLFDEPINPGKRTYAEYLREVDL